MHNQDLEHWFINIYSLWSASLIDNDNYHIVSVGRLLNTFSATFHYYHPPNDSMSYILLFPFYDELNEVK